MKEIHNFGAKRKQRVYYLQKPHNVQELIGTHGTKAIPIKDEQANHDVDLRQGLHKWFHWRNYFIQKFLFLRVTSFLIRESKINHSKVSVLRPQLKQR